MLSFAALSINRFFTTAPKLERETPGFEFNALESYPEPMYLAAGDARVRVR